MSLRITNNETTVLFDKDGNEYPVAACPVTVEHVDQDVWEVSLTLISQANGFGGMGTTRGEPSPTMSSTRSAGSGSCQAPKACPCSARPASNVNASGKSKWTNSARFRTASTCRGTSWLLRRVKEFFAVQVTSTRLSRWATFVVIASLGVGVGSLLRSVSLWLPLGVELVGFVLWVVVKSLELRHLKIAQKPETNAIARVTITPAQSASDPRSSEDAQSTNSMSSSSVGDFVAPSDPTEGDPSTGSEVTL